VFALQTAAALAYIALANNEAVRVTTIRLVRGAPILQISPVLRHAGRYLSLKPFLVGLVPEGGTALAEGARAYLERQIEGGVVFLISDFLAGEENVREALERLRARRLEVWAIHVVGRHERDLEGVRGRVRLVDSETGELRNVTVGDADRRRYRREFEERIERLREFCHRNGIGHALTSVDHALTTVFPAEGILRLR
jgi:hypothetical protein